MATLQNHMLILALLENSKVETSLHMGHLCKAQASGAETTEDVDGTEGGMRLHRETHRTRKPLAVGGAQGEQEVHILVHRTEMRGLQQCRDMHQLETHGGEKKHMVCGRTLDLDGVTESDKVTK